MNLVKKSKPLKPPVATPKEKKAKIIVSNQVVDLIGEDQTQLMETGAPIKEEPITEP